jgi:hypothetical protein
MISYRWRAISTFLDLQFHIRLVAGQKIKPEINQALFLFLTLLTP